MQNDNLIVLDLETTGLSATQDRIIEIGMLPVTADLEILDEGWSVVVTPTGVDMEALHPVVQKMHTENGLLKELANGESVGILEATRQAIHYAERFTVRGQSPLMGSTIHFDRKFLERYMPGLDKWFHYRCADVSSVKEFFKRWFPGAGEPPKVNAHRALPDCRESLAEARWYKSHLGFVEPSKP